MMLRAGDINHCVLAMLVSWETAGTWENALDRAGWQEGNESRFGTILGRDGIRIPL